MRALLPPQQLLPLLLLVSLVGRTGSKGEGLSAECVRRAPETCPASAYRRPTVGVVLVFCDEPLTFLRAWSCADPLTLYVYSKCGVDAGSHPALVHMEECTAFVKAVPSQLANDLSGMKHHAEYLDWIIEHYEGLHRMNVFLKGTFPKPLNYKDPSRVNVTDVLHEVARAEYAFKSFGHVKIMAMKGATRYHWQWQAEMCTMLSRYSCEDLCRRKKQAQDIAAVRSIWLRQYVNSLVPGGRSVKRRFVMERIWQLILGCRRDALQARPTLCAHGEHFSSGKRTGPPELLVRKGVVSAQRKAGRPTARDGIGHWYMTDKQKGPLVFVGAMVRSPALEPLHTLNGESYWSGKAQIVRYNISGDGDLDCPHWGADAVYSRIRARLEALFLADMRAGKLGPARNLVLLNPFAIVAGDVSSVFSSEEQPPPGVALPVRHDGTLPPMLTWYVRPSGMHFAQACLEEISRHPMLPARCQAHKPAAAGVPGAGSSTNMDQAAAFVYELRLQHVINCCSSTGQATAAERWGDAIACERIPCDQLPGGDVRRLACDVYGASIGGEGPSRQGHHTRVSCPYVYEHSRVAHLLPEDRPLSSNAAKKMFCIYTDDCDGKLKQGRYNLKSRHGRH
eukprot:jgi/Tetstr1/463416/TSEL_000721.t1